MEKEKEERKRSLNAVLDFLKESETFKEMKYLIGKMEERSLEKLEIREANNFRIGGRTKVSINLGNYKF